MGVLLHRTSQKLISYYQRDGYRKNDPKDRVMLQVECSVFFHFSQVKIYI